MFSKIIFYILDFKEINRQKNAPEGVFELILRKIVVFRSKSTDCELKAHKLTHAHYGRQYGQHNRDGESRYGNEKPAQKRFMA